MRKQVSTAALVALLGVSACAQDANYSGGNNNQTIGAIAGAAVGGLLGGQLGEGSGKTVAAVAGALLGAWAGSHVANSLSQQDKVYYEKASVQAAEVVPVGQTVQWYNPESGNSGTITPTREGQTNAGAYCREFQQTVTIDGETQRAYGTACRQPDGSWKIVQ